MVYFPNPLYSNLVQRISEINGFFMPLKFFLKKAVFNPFISLIRCTQRQIRVGGDFLTLSQ